MAFKFVIFFATLAAVNCGVLLNQNAYSHTAAIFPQQHVQQVQYAPQAYIQPAATIYKQPAYVKQVVAHEEPANYEFNYDVHDSHTGDIKQQSEKAVNGVISGQYSLIDADGYRRTVDYTADDHNGFNAQVRREPLGHKVVQVAQPAVAVHKIIAQPSSNPWQQPAGHYQHY